LIAHKFVFYIYHIVRSDRLFDSGIDAGVKLRPSAEELKELGPQFEKQWNEYFADAPDKPVIWIGTVSA
jgi:alcohol oxidase